jgi:glycine oxidase
MVTNDTISAHETADVIIIGGGIIGLTIARALAQRGLSKVLLIERGNLGAEASYAAGGMLAPQAEANEKSAFFDLTCQSRDLYPALASSLLDETGIDIELDRTGTLYLAFTEKDEVELEQRFEWQKRAGLSVIKLNASEARGLEPMIADNVRLALRFPDDIQVDNRRLLTALVKSNQQLGVRLVTATNVDSLRIEQGRVIGVTTSTGFVSSPRVVVAAGAWSSMLSTVDLSPGLPLVQVQPVRGQMVCLQTIARVARHVLYSPRGYLVPRRDGRVLTGSTTEHVGFAKQVTAGGIFQILKHAMEIAPALAAEPISSSWAGLRPRAADDLPVLGPCAIEGLFYATGHYRNGILLAPITGQLIAEAIVGSVISPWLNRFAPDRFELVGAQ